ncbi:peptide/nickel transport system permease protein [Maridesulfovibrio ferrireducens]|uniref:Peptide/nickel transport system permease protein n=1 Tax=Maridesulfovibrio ferrireducens TaxID=246191 RepID=A0A1G9LGW2_9BACT|nr:ABC transporter permease [Maridesulfovibrio ferrireducens]SDL61067.1 peptide/nickel transport system permease protein [Maridesulfovibrio ferrireducens]
MFIFKSAILRVATLIPVLFGVSVATFLSLAMFPGDPAEIALVHLMETESPPQEAIMQMRDELGYNSSITVQYICWLTRALKGDLGYSIQSGQAVTTEVAQAIIPSLLLASTAILLTALIAIPLGTAAAVHAGKTIDKIALGISLVLSSIPDFFLAVIFIFIFSLHLHLVPVAGYGNWYNLILPAASLALINSSITARLMRTSMLQSLRGKYILTARAKGLSETVIIGRHALKNAFPPVLHYMGAQAGHMVGGAVVVESIFLWPGLGRLLVESVRSRDIFVVQGCILTIGTAYVLIIIITDLLNLLLDPRVEGTANV